MVWEYARASYRDSTLSSYYSTQVSVRPYLSPSPSVHMSVLYLSLVMSWFSFVVLVASAFILLASSSSSLPFFPSISNISYVVTPRCCPYRLSTVGSNPKPTCLITGRPLTLSPLQLVPIHTSLFSLPCCWRSTHCGATRCSFHPYALVALLYTAGGVVPPQFPAPPSLSRASRHLVSASASLSQVARLPCYRIRHLRVYCLRLGLPRRSCCRARQPLAN